MTPFSRAPHFFKSIAFRRFRRAAVFLLLAWLAAGSVFAAPRAISFQGRLTDSSSNPLTGTYSIQFSIWDTGPGAGGTQLWSETQSINADNGIFSVLLGTVSALSPSVF